MKEKNNHGIYKDYKEACLEVCKRVNWSDDELKFIASSSCSGADYYLVDGLVAFFEIFFLNEARRQFFEKTYIRHDI